jgi:hypothetical protein
VSTEAPLDAAPIKRTSGQPDAVQPSRIGVYVQFRNSLGPWSSGARFDHALPGEGRAVAILVRNHGVKPEVAFLYVRSVLDGDSRIEVPF